MIHESAQVNAITGDIYNVLIGLGIDTHTSSLEETPRRAARALMDFTSGYHDDALWWKVFDAEGANQMVIQQDIPFFSLCEHHLLPIQGHAHIGYIPKDVVCGLSKLARVVNMYARRLQMQERMTKQIADFLQEALNPRGVIVVIEAEHLCMAMRGVQAIGALTKTSAVTGDFLDPTEGSREEFMALLGKGRVK